MSNHVRTIEGTVQNECTVDLREKTTLSLSYSGYGGESTKTTAVLYLQAKPDTKTHLSGGSILDCAGKDIDICSTWLVLMSFSLAPKERPVLARPGRAG